MTIKTFLKKHPEIKEFWIQADERKRPRMPEVFTRLQADSFDDMNHFGHWKIKSVEDAPEPGELITLHV